MILFMVVRKNWPEIGLQKVGHEFIPEFKALKIKSLIFDILRSLDTGSNGHRFLLFLILSTGRNFINYEQSFHNNIQQIMPYITQHYKWNHNLLCTETIAMFIITQVCDFFSQYLVNGILQIDFLLINLCCLICSAIVGAASNYVHVGCNYSFMSYIQRWFS